MDNSKMSNFTKPEPFVIHDDIFCQKNFRNEMLNRIKKFIIVESSRSEMLSIFNNDERVYIILC